MTIRITAAGVGKVILGRSDHPEGAVVTVGKQDGNYFVNHGFAVLVKHEPTPEEEAAEDDGRELG